MNFLFLSEKKNLAMFNFLSLYGSVSWKSNELELEELKLFDWIISFGYRHIISNKILKITKNPIINLHISYLPYNRGSDPNYWSFKDNTPKGVSIHFVDKGIDTGPILIQKKVTFSKDETLKTSYNKLINEIQILFFQNFKMIIEGKLVPKKQVGLGSFHLKKELPPKLDLNTKINNIK